MSKSSVCHQVTGLKLFICILINIIIVRTAFLHASHLFWLAVLSLSISIFQYIKNKAMIKGNEINPVVLPESDFHILKRFTNNVRENIQDDRSLSHEIERAIVVKDSAFPPNTIRINTIVEIKNLETEELLVYTLVLPQYADIRQRKISILSPMGVALIGFREGNTVNWKMPGGIKCFKVMKVDNSLHQVTQV